MKFIKSLLLALIIFSLLFIPLEGCNYLKNDAELESITQQKDSSIARNNYLNYPVRDYPIGKSGDSGLYWDCSENYFGKYSSGRQGFHSGEDWELRGGKDGEVDLGLPVYSIGKGKVVKVSDLDYLGYLVAIVHDGNFIIPANKVSSNNKEAFYKEENVNKVYSVYMHISEVPSKYYNASENNPIDVDENEPIGFILDNRGVVSEYYKCFKPIFSPDGEKLLYFTKPDAGEPFNIINIDGTAKKILGARANFFSFYFARNKIFSSDGKKIYFIGDSQEEGKNHLEEIFSIDIESNTVQQLTYDNLGYYKLFFSRDNNKIIFEASQNEVQNSNEFYIMNSDGSNMEKLSSFCPEFLNKENGIPLINENGLSIINISENLNDNILNRYSGANEDMVSEEEPIFSPDGSKIVHVAYDEKGIPELYIINTDGTQERKLITGE